MELRDLFLAQLERETASRRKAIERVPEGRADWKPHDKSMGLGYLAALCATMPGWVDFMIEKDELNFDDPSSGEFETKAGAAKAELLKMLEEGAAKSRRALEATSEEDLKMPWRFVVRGQVLSEEPPAHHDYRCGLQSPGASPRTVDRVPAAE